MSNIETTQQNTESDIKSVQNLRIKVTSPCYDDIGKVLDQLGVNYHPFNGDFNCDILFLNCGTGDSIDYSQLKSFVENGGVLYASDLTSSHLLGTWPGLMTVTNQTVACKIRADVVDADLRRYIGSTVDVEFDLSVWSKIVKTTQGKVLMQSAAERFPIMMEFEIGRGKCFYTSFHNHAQTSEMERDLLQLLVIKQISAATDLDFQKTMDILSLSLKPSETVSTGTSESPVGGFSSIVAKWKTGNDAKTQTVEEKADDIGSKWKK